MSNKTVSYEDYLHFVSNFDKRVYKHERFGQAFMNHFNISGPDPKLFYAESRKDAEGIIWTKYLNWSESK